MIKEPKEIVKDVENIEDFEMKQFVESLEFDQKLSISDH